MALKRLPMRVESNSKTTNTDERSAAVKTRAASAAMISTILKVKPPLLIQFLKPGLRRFIVDYQHDGEEHLVTGYFVDLPPTWGRKSK